MKHFDHMNHMLLCDIALVTLHSASCTLPLEVYSSRWRGPAFSMVFHNMRLPGTITQEFVEQLRISVIFIDILYNFLGWSVVIILGGHHSSSWIIILTCPVIWGRTCPNDLQIWWMARLLFDGTRAFNTKKMRHASSTAAALAASLSSYKADFSTRSFENVTHSQKSTSRWSV